MAALPDAVATIEAARAMAREDSERFGRRCAARPVRHSLDTLTLADTRADDRIDAELAHSARVALDAELDGLATAIADSASLTEAAALLGVHQGTVSRAVQRARKKMQSARMD